MKITSVISVCFLFLAFSACKQEPKAETEVPAVTETVEEIVEVNIRGEEVEYQSDTTLMKGYMAWNEQLTGKVPGIIVIHEWWGHNDYTRERADMLAEMGYVAFAIDMYGEGKQAKHPEEAGKFAGMVMKNMPEAKARFNAAMEVLKSNEQVDPEKIAVIGYCFGGSVALTMANAGADVDAVAAFHSGIALPVPPGEDLKARVLVCNGADDPMVTQEDVIAFKAAMDKAGANYEYIAYENAVHAFTSKGADALGEEFGLPLAYNEEADRKSWEALRSMLDEVFE